MAGKTLPVCGLARSLTYLLRQDNGWLLNIESVEFLYTYKLVESPSS